MSAAAARLKPLLLAGFALMLAAGLMAGLARFGWLSAGHLAGLHGPLMICAGLGSLIGLERAAASPWRFAWLAPVASLTGGLALLLGAAPILTGTCFLAAALIQLNLLLPLRLNLTQLLQLGGLGCWCGGSLLWVSGRPMPLVAIVWSGLLVLTIAASRLEKIQAQTQAQSRAPGFALAAALYLIGLGLSPFIPKLGLPLAGLGLLAMALWLMRRDPACRAQTGAPGLTAACLLSGYLWLCSGGLLLLGGPEALQGPRYDMTLHSLFVGFSFSLILGHLPQLLPRLLGRDPVYHPALWLPTLTLGLSLLLRCIGGLSGLVGLRAWGGLLNAGALAAFVLMLLWLLRAGATAPRLFAPAQRRRAACGLCSKQNPTAPQRQGRPQ